VRHVDEPAVVALERDGDLAGRAVAVPGHDQVASPGQSLMSDIDFRSPQGPACSRSNGRVNLGSE
jgi:hypothetical protein